MPALTVNLAGVLILTKRNLAWTHFDANTVHRLDEPAAGQRNDPLRPRIFVPVSDPANRKDRHEDRRVMPRLGADPLRRGCGLDRSLVKLSQLAPGLVADPIGVGPDMPIWDDRRGFQLTAVRAPV